MECSGSGIASSARWQILLLLLWRCLKGSHIPERQLLEFDRCRWLDADIVRHPRRAGVRGNFLAYLKERRLVYPDRTRQLRGRALDRPHADDVPCFRRIVRAKLEKNARKLELTPRLDTERVQFVIVDIAVDLYPRDRFVDRDLRARSLFGDDRRLAIHFEALRVRAESAAGQVCQGRIRFHFRVERNSEVLKGRPDARSFIVKVGSTVFLSVILLSLLLDDVGRELARTELLFSEFADSSDDLRGTGTGDPVRE